MGINLIDLLKLDNILGLVFKELCYNDVLNVRQTCKHLANLPPARDAWVQMLRRDLKSQQLVVPRYCRPIKSLSRPDCEALILRNVRLRKNLANLSTRGSPLVSTMNGARSITWTRLVQGHWLLVASSDQSSSRLSLWSIPALFGEPPTEYPNAEAYLEGPVNNGFVEVQDGRIVIALELRPLLRDVVVVLTVMEANGRTVFGSLARHEGVSCLRALQGPTLAFALHKQRSIPSLLNWRTGAVMNLLPMPDALGGAIAMTMNEDIVAVVSPRRLRIFTLNDDHAWMLAQTIDIPHSIGYAAIRILPHPRSSGAARELRMTIAGQDGLFLHGITQAQPSSPFLASLLWSRPGEDLVLPHCPVFDQDCEFLSWMEGDQGDIPHRVNFLTTYCGSQSEPGPHEYPVFELDHPDMPALYAMGVFDYDGALGLAVFGNVFGELAVFDLSGINVGGVAGCFEKTRFSPSDGCVAIVPDVPVPVTFHPPFPYLGGRLYPDSMREQFFTYWRSHPVYPDPGALSGRWQLDGLGEDFHGPEWYHYMPLLPQAECDRAWIFEHAQHIYGTVTPLVTCYNLNVCHAGGLLYLFFGCEEDVYVAQPGISLEAFLASLNVEWDFPRPLPNATQYPVADDAVRNRGYMCRCMWDWERLVEGRDRWAEMSQRGADIHPSTAVVEDSEDELIMYHYALDKLDESRNLQG